MPVVDRADREAVHQLERDRLEPGRGHVADRLTRGRGGREEGDERRPRRWRRAEAEDRLGDEPERPLRPDEQLAQGVAGDVLHGPAAGADDLAVGEDDLEAEDRVAGLAVLDAAQAAGVRAEVAADRALLVARRIRGVEQPLRGDGRLERGVDDPRLGHDEQVRPVDLEDAVHPGEGDRQRPVDPGRSAGQSRPGAAWDDRHAVSRGEAHELGDLGGLGRQGDGERQAGVEIRSLIKAIGLPVDLVAEEPEVRQPLGDRGEERGLGRASEPAASRSSVERLGAPRLRASAAAIRRSAARARGICRQVGRQDATPTPESRPRARRRPVVDPGPRRCRTPRGARSGRRATAGQTVQSYAAARDPAEHLPTAGPRDRRRGGRGRRSGREAGRSSGASGASGGPQDRPGEVARGRRRVDRAVGPEHRREVRLEAFEVGREEALRAPRRPGRSAASPRRTPPGAIAIAARSRRRGRRWSSRRGWRGPTATGPGSRAEYVAAPVASAAAGSRTGPTIVR